MATLVVGPFFLSFGLGLDAALVGLVMAVGPVTAALAGIPAGRATDRFGTRRVLAAGLAQMVVGLIFRAFRACAMCGRSKPRPMKASGDAVNLPLTTGMMRQRTSPLQREGAH